MKPIGFHVVSGSRQVLNDEPSDSTWRPAFATQATPTFRTWGQACWGFDGMHHYVIKVILQVLRSFSPRSIWERPRGQRVVHPLQFRE